MRHSGAAGGTHGTVLTMGPATGGHGDDGGHGVAANAGRAVRIANESSNNHFVFMPSSSFQRTSGIYP